MLFETQHGQCQTIGKLKQDEQCALASAGFIYESKSHFIRPQADLVEGCAPTGYEDYGKTAPAYCGLRVSPDLAVSYANWGKAKQLSWDRACDKNDNLCIAWREHFRLQIKGNCSTM